MSSRPAWAILKNPVSKKQKRKRKEVHKIINPFHKNTKCRFLGLMVKQGNVNEAGDDEPVLLYAHSRCSKKIYYVTLFLLRSEQT
jgi:hypothetical protein